MPCPCRFLQTPDVRGVLDERLGVLVPLEDDALVLVVIEIELYCSVPVSLVRTISMHRADKRLNSSSLPSSNVNRAMP